MTLNCSLELYNRNLFYWTTLYRVCAGLSRSPLCSGSPGNERAGDNQNHLNDLNDELALLIGIERLDQLFNLYYFLRDITEENMIKNEFVL